MMVGAAKLLSKMAHRRSSWPSWIKRQCCPCKLEPRLLRLPGTSWRRVCRSCVSWGSIFRVVDPFPERKKYFLPGHVDRPASAVTLLVLRLDEKPQPTHCRVVADGAEIRQLDLARVDIFELLLRMHMWMDAEQEELRASLPPSARRELQSLDALTANGTAEECAGKVWQDLDSERAFAHLGRRCSVDRLRWYSKDVLAIMAKHGVIDAYVDEFGVEEVALRASRVGFSTPTRVSDPVPAVALPRSSSLVDASKLELLIELAREGWVIKNMVVDPVLADGPRELGLHMLARSKKYWEAMCDVEAIFKRGCPGVFPNKPVAYYACLFALPDLPALHAHPGFDTLSNKRFLEMLKAGCVDVAPGDEAPDMMALDDDRDELLAIQDAGADDEGEPPLPPPLCPPLEGVEAALMAFGHVDVEAGGPIAPVQWTRFTVRWDRWSHQSGRLRCYTRCLDPSHERCFRYMFQHLAESRNHAAATLFAWAELGVELTREQHQSRASVLAEARVRHIEYELGPL